MLVYGSFDTFTWHESVKRDMNDWDVAKELAMDRRAWKPTIHVPEP